MPSQFRLTARRIITAVTVAALLVPASASARIMYDPPANAGPKQDLRVTDTRDAVNGSAAAPAPEPRPAVPSDDGIDWPSAGIGAALFGGLVFVGFGIATVRRVRPRAVS